MFVDVGGAGRSWEEPGGAGRSPGGAGLFRKEEDLRGVGLFGKGVDLGSK